MTPPLTAADLLKVGAWFARDGQRFEITAWDARSPLQVEARAEGTDAGQAFTLTDLFAPTPVTRFAASRAELLTRPGPATATAVDVAAVPAHLLQRAERLVEIVETVQAALAQPPLPSADARSLTERTRQACQALPTPISLSAYYVARRRYQAVNGDRARLAAALRRTTYGKTRLDPNAQHFIDTLVRRFYRTNPPLRAQTVYAIAQQVWAHTRHWWVAVQQAADAEGMALVERLLDVREPIDPLLADPVQTRRLVQIPLPSRSWFYGYVRWFGGRHPRQPRSVSLAASRRRSARMLTKRPPGADQAPRRAIGQERSCLLATPSGRLATSAPQTARPSMTSCSRRATATSSWCDGTFAKASTSTWATRRGSRAFSDAAAQTTPDSMVICRALSRGANSIPTWHRPQGGI